MLTTTKTLFFTAALVVTAITCKSNASENQVNGIPANQAQSPNHLQNITGKALGEFKWLNKPQSVQFKDGTMKVTVPAKSDFFTNPENKDVSASAPLFYQEVEGDFVATALVKPNFKDQWNACALMVHIDESNWIKFAFENSDATGKSIVSVVTRGVSDDANGVRLNTHDKIWLRLIRKGNNFAMHWSSDGKEFVMTRLAQMPDAPRVKVGLEAQSPVGQSVEHEFLYFNLEKKSVKDLRVGL